MMLIPANKTLSSQVQLLLISIFLTLNAFCVSAQSNFSKLIVFGDSLSDTGNLAVIDLPFPYYNNRISDGPVMADLLAQHIGSTAQTSGHLLGNASGYNYAVAGGNILGSDPEDLPSQVNAYLSRVTLGADPDALYLVFAGGNDLRGLRSQTSNAAAQVTIQSIVAELDTQLQRLVNAGARALIVPNVANIGRIPETLQRRSGDPNISARAQAYTQAYNQSLSQMLNKYKSNQAISIIEFDLYGAFETVLNNPSDFGFTTTTEGCFDPDQFDIATECALFGFDRRPFFDQLHPSSATNAIIAVSLISRLPALPNVSTNKKANIAPILLLLLADD